MRVSTNSLMRNYNSRLNQVLGNLNIANQKVITGRKFLTASESPVEAARAYQLRRSLQDNTNYLDNLENVNDMFASTESSLMNVSKMASSAYSTMLDAINGTKSLDERKIIAGELRGMQKSMVLSLNSKFNDKFLFGGSSTKNDNGEPVPFELKDGKLLYRGIDVTDPDAQNALKELADEKIYVDLGFGLNEDANGIVDNSAYNIANAGISYLGFGTDHRDNLILNLGEMADLLEAETIDPEAIKECTDRLEDQKLRVLRGVTTLGTETQFLKTTKTMLEDNEYNLKNKIANVEQIDMEAAIMAFKEADYVYKAALKMGSSILSPSFIDYMK